MALKIVKTKKEYEYIPLSERGEKNPATFIIRPLTRSEQAKLEDKVLNIDSVLGTISMANASYLLNAFIIGVKDVKNIIDEDGKEIKPVITDKGIDVSFLDLLPDDIIREVAEVIINISKNPQDADIFLGNIDKDKKEKA